MLSQETYMLKIEVLIYELHNLKKVTGSKKKIDTWSVRGKDFFKIKKYNNIQILQSQDLGKM